jgi:hypothetical protein
MSATSPNMLNIQQMSLNEKQEWLQTVFVGFRVYVDSSIRIMHENERMMEALSLELKQCGITNESGSKKFVESSMEVFIGPYYINLSDTDLSLLNEHKFDAASIQLQVNEAWAKEMAERQQDTHRNHLNGNGHNLLQNLYLLLVAAVHLNQT